METPTSLPATKPPATLAALLQSGMEKCEAAHAILVDARCNARDAALPLLMGAKRLAAAQATVLAQPQDVHLPPSRAFANVDGKVLSKARRDAMLGTLARLEEYGARLIHDDLEGLPSAKELAHTVASLERVAASLRRFDAGALRRHRMVVMARLVAVLVLLGGLGGVGWRAWQSSQTAPLGWRGEYFSNEELKGAGVVRVDRDLAFYWDTGVPMEGIPEEHFSVRWDGCLKVEKAGKAKFLLGSDDGARMFVDGKSVLDGWGPRSLSWSEGNAELTEGLHHLRVEFMDKVGVATVVLKMGWDGAEPKTLELGQVLSPGVAPLVEGQECTGLH